MTPFITNNAGIIANYTQQAFPLRLRKQNGQYRNCIQQALQNNDFENALPSIPDPIDRQGVIDCYEMGLYEGFIATLLWGGKQLEHFGGMQHIINNNSKATIVDHITNVKDLLEQNNVVEAYNSMLPQQPNYISGVNTSYFTKILYFLSHDMNLEYHPLILDNVMQWVRCAFMIESGDNYHNYYHIENNELQTQRNNYNGTVYVEYLSKMQTKAGMIGVAPDKLEAFLFSSCPTLTGEVPRQYVRDYVINNF